jgi:putative effector of murein hydrolase
MTPHPLAAPLGFLDAHAPIGALALTLGGYLIAQLIWRAGRRNALLNPTLIAVLLIAGLLALSEFRYEDYFAQTTPLSLLLGPAVVGLALPLHRNLLRLRESAGRIGVAVLAGNISASWALFGLTAGLGASRAVMLSLLPKSATTGISTALAADFGGIPAVTAVVTIATGIVTACLAPVLFDRLGITDPVTRGVAYGAAGHGIATARGFQESDLTGSAAALAMGLNGILTCALLPVLLRLFG